MSRIDIASRNESTNPDDGSPVPASSRRLLGQGRSGQVFEEVMPSGDRLACKVFVPDPASSVVNTILTGAVNPYRWDDHAVACAVLRRRILERLVPWWFDGRVRLPVTHGSRWFEPARAHELRAELVEGRHAMLRHPTAGDARGELPELLDDVLVPLQGHLAEAGFDGLLWQAGRGNPVATANFMRSTAPGEPARWLWIDAESGVPGLFSLNPWHLVRTYLPLSVKHRRWIFDDVDVDRLAAYVERHAPALGVELGAPDLQSLRQDVEELRDRQLQWRDPGRHERSVASHSSSGAITAEQARHYRTRPVRWLLRLVGQGIVRVPGSIARRVARFLPALAPRALAARLARWTRFFTSHQVRETWANGYVANRLRDWRQRGFLDPAEADAITASMHGTEEATYVADFAVHLAIKPGVKLVTLGVAPLLYLWGVIESGALVAGIAVYGGATSRTLYTLGRSVQALIRGRAAPWVALLAGLIPVIGSAAYPLQMLSSTKGHEGHVSRFLLHDILSGVGRRIPIWGGRDTLFEHRCNALARIVTRA